MIIFNLNKKIKCIFKDDLTNSKWSGVSEQLIIHSEQNLKTKAISTEQKDIDFYKVILILLKVYLLNVLRYLYLDLIKFKFETKGGNEILQ